ncbi:hypothetical protein EYF80_046151 [Liparis tanakae]|uniref:Uncharacterized protein n=1 Tax=Liparis tanakae TaxID=230148 RepID=A0A4Z2FRM9_9TELE|nr:hypothetical protein EYF80_046151 [Liparis tanakae]
MKTNKRTASQSLDEAQGRRTEETGLSGPADGNGWRGVRKQLMLTTSDHWAVDVSSAYKLGVYLR